MCRTYIEIQAQEVFWCCCWSKLGLGQGEALRLGEETFKKKGGPVHDQSEAEVKKVGQVHEERLRPHLSRGTIERVVKKVGQVHEERL